MRVRVALFVALAVVMASGSWAAEVLNETWTASDVADVRAVTEVVTSTNT